MILRKPFAMLIKYFKVIHLTLTLLAIYSIIKTSSILSFFNEYIASNRTILGDGLTDSLFNNFMYAAVIFIIFISIVVFILMKYKKKKSFFYLIVVCIYVYNYFLYSYAFSTVSILENGLVDIRVLKVIKDLYITLLILQYLTAIIMVIRTTGFDIKKFDFASDIDELEISDVDREEFLINIEFNSNEFKSNLKKKLRHIKYAYKENKLFTNLLILLVISIVCFGIYYNVGVYNKVYKNGESFKTNDLIMNVVDAYITNTDSKDNNIFNNYKLIVVKLNVRNLNRKTIMHTSKFYIKKNSERYYATTDYNNYVNDLGNIYDEEKISSDFVSYNIVFRIPKDDLNDLYLIYTENNDKEIKIKLQLNDLDSNNDSEQYNLGEEIVFNNNILKDSKFVINEFDKKEYYIENYNYCLNTNNCYNSIEYIEPSIYLSEDRSLIKIKGNFELGDKINNTKLSTLEKLLINNSKIVYTINGVEEESYIYKTVKPNKINTDYKYLEVDKNVIYGESFKLVINLRDKEYVYILN